MSGLYLPGFDPGGGGGGAAYTPLVPGADPAAQNLASGTTSSAGVTFNAPTGGSGAVTYSAAVVHTQGSGATATDGGSDDSLGPWTVSGLADSDICDLVLTATDAGAVSQTVTMSAAVSVAPASSAPSWYAVQAWDLTGIDTQDISTDGSYTLQKSAVDFLDIEVDTSGSPGVCVVTADTNGITVTADDGTSNGGKSVAFDITDVLAAGATAVASDYTEPIALQFLITTASISGGSTRFAAGWSDQATLPHQSTPAMMGGVRYDGAGTVDLIVREYDGSTVETTMEDGAAGSTNYLITVRYDRGIPADVDVVPAATSFSDPPDDGWYGGLDVIAAAATYPVTYATPHAGFAAIRIGNTDVTFRVTGVRLIRYGVEP